MLRRKRRSLNRPETGYEKEYRDKAESLDITYITPFEDTKGYLNGMSYKEIIEYFGRIDKCTCGGEPSVIQTEGMGELETTISCKSCDRYVSQSDYDREDANDVGCEELALRKWNAGMTQEEIDRIKEEKWEKKRLREEDMVWHPVYPNNMPDNGEAGIYCLIFKESSDGIYCCKWTIEYQLEETGPMCTEFDAKTEAYILHMKRYFDVKGPLEYPEPNNHRDRDIIRDIHREDRPTLHNCDINDYGDFVRAYKTLEEAKAGALARCGWQGLNRETVLRRPDAAMRD